jgi:hypothetical protein
MIKSKEELTAELEALGLKIKNRQKRYRVIKQVKKQVKKKYGVEL